MLTWRKTPRPKNEFVRLPCPQLFGRVTHGVLFQEPIILRQCSPITPFSALKPRSPKPNERQQICSSQETSNFCICKNLPAAVFIMMLIFKNKLWIMRSQNSNLVVDSLNTQLKVFLAVAAWTGGCLTQWKVKKLLYEPKTRSCSCSCSCSCNQTQFFQPLYLTPN